VYKPFQKSKRVRPVNADRSSPNRGRNIDVKVFSSEYPPCWGGVGKHVQNICRRVCSKVNLQLVTATYGRPVEQFEINNLARIHVKSFPVLLAEYLSGLRFVRLNDDELIHVHVPHAFLPNGKANARIVATFHVVWAEYSEALGHEQPLSMFDLQFTGMNRRLIKAERKLASLSRAVIAVSKSVKHELVSRYNLDSEKVHVIYNGVNRDEYCPSRERGNFFLYVGRQTAHKGLPYLLEAFAKFVRSNPEHMLLIVGERLEGGVDPSLVRLAKTLGILERVKFTGRLPPRETSQILGKAKCLILPSLAEAFGMTVLEAMASETPVIATRVGGIPEVVQDGRNGLLVGPADPNALSDAMERIASDSRLQRMLSQEGVRTCRCFTWDDAARKTVDVYREACS
jgi:starch synthase